MTSKLIASELAKIERLNGTNYDMWSRKIRYGLIHDNLESAIEKDGPTLGEESSDAEKEEYEQWKICDKKAKSLMLMFMEDNLIKVFETYESAKKLWDSLKEKYDAISDVNVQLLLHKYNTCKMSESDNVIDHCNKMLVMAKDLAAAGNELSENMQIAGILNSLPSSLNMAATTLRLNGTIKSASQLSAALAMEHDLVNSRKRLELNLAQEEEFNLAQAKFKSSYQNKGQGRLGPSKGRVFKPHQQRKKFPLGSCYNCGKYGHFKNECPENQEGDEGKGKDQKEQNKREFVGVIECNAGHVATDIDGWWIDSGATRHIAKTKQGLTEFEELKKGEQRIFMGNNTYLDVVGIGSYRLDLGDSVMVLKNVMFAPGMRRNLVSVPALLKNGLEVRFYNNRVSIGKDKKVYAMGKYEPDHELFKL